MKVFITLLVALMVYAETLGVTVTGNNSVDNPIQINSVPAGAIVRIQYAGGYFTNWDLSEQKPWWGAYAGDCVTIRRADGRSYSPFSSASGYYSTTEELIDDLSNLSPLEFTQAGGDTLSINVWVDAGATASTATGRDGSMTVSIDWTFPDTNSCADVLTGAVTYSSTPDGKGVQATFKPKNVQTLQEAADICGVDHFNWINLAIYYDDPYGVTHQGITPTAPFIDPPYGGWDYQTGGDDSKDGYWDEDSGELQSYTSTDTLTFLDYPVVSPGSRVRFRTYLVGVDATGSYVYRVVGDRFEWESTSLGSSPVLKNTDSSLITTTNGISPIEVLDTRNISDPERESLIAAGFTVPQSLSEHSRLSIEPTTQNAVAVEFTTLPGYSYELLKSSDLDIWTNACEIVTSEVSSTYSRLESTEGTNSAFFKVEIHSTP